MMLNRFIQEGGATVEPSLLFRALAALEGETMEAVEQTEYASRIASGEWVDALLSEATSRAHLVPKKITVQGKNGKTYQRTVLVRAEVPGAKERKAAQAAASKEVARRMIERGIKGPAQARVLAAHLKNLTVKDAQELAAVHSAKLAGRLKADKVNNLVAFAQGRGSVVRGATPTAAPVSAPTPQATTPPAPAAAPQAATVSKAAVADAVLGEFEARIGKSATRMVPIHEIRDAIRVKLGDAAASDEVFNDVMLDLRRSKKVRLVSIDDRSRATEKQLADSVFAVGETFFYVERV